MSANPTKLLLSQAAYVLKNLHVERPGCGYDKLSEACKEVADNAVELCECDHPKGTNADKCFECFVFSQESE